MKNANRVNLFLDDPTYAALEEVRDRLSATSYTETIRRAILVLNTLTKDGNRVHVTDANGKSHEVYIV
jgi:hypothetical protein